MEPKPGLTLHWHQEVAYGLVSAVTRFQKLIKRDEASEISLEFAEKIFVTG